jgi:hypothetical protein
MVLEVGDRIHVITRRQFEEDLRRHFVGEVIAVNETAARVHGYAFVMDSMLNEFVKRPTSRTRVFGIADSGFVIAVLPHGIAVDALRYESHDRRLILTDGGGFQMDINEFGAG